MGHWEQPKGGQVKEIGLCCWTCCPSTFAPPSARNILPVGRWFCFGLVWFSEIQTFLPGHWDLQGFPCSLWALRASWKHLYWPAVQIPQRGNVQVTPWEETKKALQKTSGTEAGKWLNTHTHRTCQQSRGWSLAPPSPQMFPFEIASLFPSPKSSLISVTLALYCFTFRTLRSQKVLCTMKKLLPLDWKLSATAYCIQC